MVGYSSSDLTAALYQVGLRRGDLILVSSDLLRLGRMTDAATGEGVHELILNSIFEVIGRQEGTLITHAYTTQVGRYGVPFVLESTECINGAFCQYVLGLPGVVRSLHPINSFAGLGRLKREICLDASASNYGLDSPLDRMLKRRGEIVAIGLDYSHSAFVHYVESMYGVPYVYNKLLDVEVFAEGRRVDRPFFASVRYLDYPLVFEWGRLRRALEEKGCVRSAPVGGGRVNRVGAVDYCETVLELLKSDPYALLKEPPRFEKGKVPFDGATAGRDGISEKGNYRYASVR